MVVAMNDLHLTRTGTILMHQGKIHIGGFDGDGFTCRGMANHALLWAIGELQRELAENIRRPGGSGNVSIDLPPSVHKALGLPDPWDDAESDE